MDRFSESYIYNYIELQTENAGIGSHSYHYSWGILAGLKDGKIAGAALDVLEKDPPLLTNIMNTDKIIYTPHVAWNSVEAEKELRKSAAQEVKRVLEGGKPLNLINKEVLKYY